MKIISEIGINHNGDFRKMEELIRQSSIGGADYAKFQLYNSVRVFGDESRKKNEFTFNQVKTLKEICDYYNIEFFASVFDEEKLEWCESLDVKLYKIASRTVVAETKLCLDVISKNKPVYISLGFWEKEGVPFEGYNNIKYLNCISKYPTSFIDLQNLKYNNDIIGLSDHSYGIAYALHNISLGAKVIEKHFTLNRSDIGNDHIGSMDLNELKLLREYGNQLENIHNKLSNA
jgi:N,N'-diacetyllegionaminate synthase|tara:strand:+ start:1598 stop:2293 length:696 start_codon:yes stop_codon:yes gene_type:complete